MNAVKAYNNLLERNKRAEEEQSLLEKETERIIERKLKYLYEVGVNVLNKKLGKDWRKLGAQFYGWDMEWLKYETTVKSFSSGVIVLYSEGAIKLRPRGEFTIPVDFLHLSDRDLAKKIRRNIYEHKNHLRRHEARVADAEIEKLKLSIIEAEDEIRRLTNLKVDAINNFNKYQVK